MKESASTLPCPWCLGEDLNCEVRIISGEHIHNVKCNGCGASFDRVVVDVREEDSDMDAVIGASIKEMTDEK